MNDRARGWWVSLLATLTGALWFGAGTEAAFGFMKHRRWDWVEMVARGVPWAVAMVGVQWVVRALVRPGERRARAELAQLRRTGKLPSNADPAELHAFLQEERGRMRTGGWVLLLASAALAALVAVAAATVNDNSPAVWAVAVLSALLGVAEFRWQRRELARTDGLLRELSGVSR